MIFKKVITTFLAADFAFGAIACSAKKAEERTLETMSAIEQRIDEKIEEITPDCSTKTTTAKSKSTNRVNNPYVKKNLGTFSLTFYVPDAKWGYATATGERPIHLQTCAVDPKVIPYGSTILVVGNNGRQLVLRANDCGSGIKNSRLDIFWDKSISEGYAYFADFGTMATVYILEE